MEPYERVIRDLDRPPIIMGHSIGGLVTQTPEQFHCAFTNTLREEQSLEVYKRFAVPQARITCYSKRPLRISILIPPPPSISTMEREHRCCSFRAERTTSRPLRSSGRTISCIDSLRRSRNTKNIRSGPTIHLVIVRKAGKRWPTMHSRGLCPIAAGRFALKVRSEQSVHVCQLDEKGMEFVPSCDLPF